MNAGHLCTRTVVFALPGNSVTHAAGLMRDFDVGDVVVVEEDNGLRRPVGIVTDRDVTTKVVAHDLDPGQLDVDEIMLQDIVTVDEDLSIEEVAHTMKTHGVRRTPVVNAQGGLEGILSFDDIVDHLAEQMADLAGLVQRQQRHQKEVLTHTSPEEEIPPPSRHH